MSSYKILIRCLDCGNRFEIFATEDSPYCPECFSDAVEEMEENIEAFGDEYDDTIEAA